MNFEQYFRKLYIIRKQLKTVYFIYPSKFFETMKSAQDFESI